VTEEIQKRMTDLLPGLMGDPRAFVHDIDWRQGTALVVEADETFFRDAIFLDNRVLEGVKVGAHVPLSRLLQEVDKIKTPPEPCRFIFHTGHAGSTLISRLLDELPDVLGLREPLLLRSLAMALNDIRGGKIKGGEKGLGRNLERVYRLLTRTFSPHQKVIIKATSICNNLAPGLLGFHAGNRALGLYVGLETMLANMLMKDQVTDISGFAQTRLEALKAHLPGVSLHLEELTPAGLIALSWIAEIYECFLTSTGPQAPKVRFLNFDDFLADPGKGIERILSGLSLDHDSKTVETLGYSRVFDFYAKQPGFQYQAADRALSLEESRRKNHAGIGEGLEFAQALANRHPELNKVFEKFPLA